MKKLSLLLSILIILGAIAYFVLLKKPEFILNDTTIINAVEQFNKTNPDFKIVVDKGNVKITPTKDSGLLPKYRIEIINGEFSTTAKAVYKLFSLPDADKVENINFIKSAESLVMIFEPTNKNLYFRSAEGITVTTEIPDKVVDNIAVKMTVASVDATDFNLSSILNQQSKQFDENYIQTIIDNPKYNLSMNDLQMKVTPNKPKKGEPIQFLNFNIKKATVQTDNNKRLLKMIYDQTTDIDTTPFSKPGAQANTTSVALDNINLNIIGEGKKDGLLKLGRISMNTELAPSKTTTDTFFFDFNYQVKEGEYVHFDPADKDGVKAESLAKLQDIKSQISIDSLSPEVITFYIQLMRELQGEMQDNPQAAQDFLFGSMDDLKAAFVKTNPKVSISFDPIAHELGKGDINGEFAFSKETIFPIGDAKANIYKAQETIEKLLTQKLIQQKDAERLQMKLKQFFKNDGSGNYNAHFEIIEQPPFFMLNGEPLK